MTYLAACHLANLLRYRCPRRIWGTQGRGGGKSPEDSPRRPSVSIPSQDAKTEGGALSADYMKDKT